MGNIQDLLGKGNIIHSENKIKEDKQIEQICQLAETMIEKNNTLKRDILIDQIMEILGIEKSEIERIEFVNKILKKIELDLYKETKKINKEVDREM